MTDALGAGHLASSAESADDYRAGFVARLPAANSADLDQIDRLALADSQRREPAAIEALGLASVVASDGIPLALLASGATAALIARCGGSGLVRLDGGLVSVPPLIQTTRRERRPETIQKTGVEQIVGRLNAAVRFDRQDPATWAPILTYLPHPEAAANFASEFDTALAPAGRLLNQTGLYLESQGQMADAVAVYTRALGLAERAFGLNHPTVAVVLRNLALATLYVGDQNAAKGQLERALTISEANSGPSSPGAQTVADTLAVLYLDQGQFAEALPLVCRVLAGKREQGDLPGICLGLQRLGTVLQRLGSDDEARVALDEAIVVAAELGDRVLEANLLIQLANLDGTQGNQDLFLQRLAVSVGLYQAASDAIGEARAFREVGASLTGAGRLAEARRVVAVSYLLFASLGRPEADEMYGQLVRLTADLKLPAGSIVELLQPATEQYQNDRGAALLRSLQVTPLRVHQPIDQVLAPDSRPHFSIIMLAHNLLEMTKRCIESVQQHISEPFELILVDNGSSDGTAEYFRLLANARVIVNSDNLGFATGCNQGMAIARGDFVVLLNNDTIVSTGWLTKLARPSLEDHRIGIVGPRSNAVAGRQMVNGTSYSAETEFDEFAAAFAAKYSGLSTATDVVVGFCMLIRREVIDAIGGLDERFGRGNFEDNDYCLRAALAGFRLAIAEDCFVHHDGNRTSCDMGIDNSDLLYQNWRIFRKKWDIAAAEDFTPGYLNLDHQRYLPFRRDQHYVPVVPSTSTVPNGVPNLPNSVEDLDSRRRTAPIVSADQSSSVPHLLVAATLSDTQQVGSGFAESSPLDRTSEPIAALLPLAHSIPRNNRLRSVANDQPESLYLDLVKRSVTNMIFGQQTERQYSARLRAEGRDSTAPELAQTMIGLKRLDCLQYCLETVIADRISGDVIETGVWRGGAAILLRAVLKSYRDRDRVVWLTGSFSEYGAPAPADGKKVSTSEQLIDGEITVSLDEVMDNFQRYGLLDGQVRFVKGSLIDVIPGVGLGDLALAHLGTRTHAATLDSLIELYPRITAGGFIVVDHYASSGCREAVDDFRRSNHVSDSLVGIDWSGVYWRKIEA